MEIQANAFLHHMVRNIMGVLTAVGAGEKPLAWIPEVLNAKDRQAAGVTAPPHGLYLVHVDYPDEYRLPKMNPGPGFVQVPLGGFKSCGAGK